MKHTKNDIHTIRETKKKKIIILSSGSSTHIAHIYKRSKNYSMTIEQAFRLGECGLSQICTYLFTWRHYVCVYLYTVHCCASSFFILYKICVNRLYLYIYVQRQCCCCCCCFRCISLLQEMLHYYYYTHTHSIYSYFSFIAAI